MKPQHIFVANFIGESNFLEGYVSKVDKKETTIELRGDISVQALDQKRKKGEKVAVAVRPEVLVVEKEKKKRKFNFRQD